MQYNKIGLENHLRAEFSPLGTHADANVRDFVNMCEIEYTSHQHDFHWLRQGIHQYLTGRGIINDVDYTNRVAEVVQSYFNHEQ